MSITRNVVKPKIGHDQKDWIMAFLVKMIFGKNGTKTEWRISMFYRL